MSKEVQNDDMHSKSSFLQRFLRVLLGRKKAKDQSEDLDREIHLEPKYWPEVKDFMTNLDEIIESHTIEDDNIKRINQRIVDYIEEQINKKGQLEDINARYAALNTLADRILSNNLNKLVGLKENSTSSADFSNAVNEFKQKLDVKKDAELREDSNGQGV